jgi:hypothetical protein
MKKSGSTYTSNSVHLYVYFYILLVLLEMSYIILAWSPYGKPTGTFSPFYKWVKNNLDLFVLVSMLFIVLFSFIFPGFGIFALLVTVYRVAEMCCNENKEYSKEHFGDGLLFGGGGCSNDTIFDQGCLENTRGITTGTSSALGDNEDGCFSLSNSCNLAYFGSVFQNRIRPRGIFTTSLLAKQIGER